MRLLWQERPRPEKPARPGAGAPVHSHIFFVRSPYGSVQAAGERESQELKGFARNFVFGGVLLTLAVPLGGCQNEQVPLAKEAPPGTPPPAPGASTTPPKNDLGSKPPPGGGSPSGDPSEYSK